MEKPSNVTKPMKIGILITTFGIFIAAGIYALNSIPTTLPNVRSTVSSNLTATIEPKVTSKALPTTTKVTQTSTSISLTPPCCKTTVMPSTTLTPTQIVSTVIPTKSAPSTTTVTIANTQQTITTANNGSTIKVHVGDTLVMNLGTLFPKLTYFDPTTFKQLTNPTGTSQGNFQATAAGETKITATSHLPCEDARPRCMIADTVFTLNVSVQ